MTICAPVMQLDAGIGEDDVEAAPEGDDLVAGAVQRRNVEVAAINGRGTT